jgi:signal transduction histidine kinase
MLGVLAVGADGVMSVRRSALTKALAPLEALAFKVERAMENAALAKRLQCAEKLAGLGMLAGGVAHALNNPLTAVLGFAELIADTAGENRVKEDAEIIVREAVRMQQTVEMLQEFSQPRAPEKVDVAELVQELAKECAEKLAGRGVRLVVQTGDEVAAVLGNRDRLRQMSEHLLNNAAQALAWMDSAAMGEEKVIRMTVGRNGPMVHLLVSDSGPGFAEPGRVFEPFRMKGRVGDRVGLGLGICYGIVHEHGGEISAFNLSPHGAAIAVELPV